MDMLSLRDVTDADAEEFFAHRRARGIARPSDRGEFIARWRRQRADTANQLRAIVVAEELAGYIAQFRRDGLPEVCYELGPQYWGRGFATAALAQLLREITVRPLYARVAKDNLASIRVLEKNGFALTGEDTFLTADGVLAEEFVFVLAGSSMQR